MNRERFSLNAGRDNAPKDYLRRSVLADMVHDAARNPDRVIFWILVLAVSVCLTWGR